MTPSKYFRDYAIFKDIFSKRKVLPSFFSRRNSLLEELLATFLFSALCQLPREEICFEKT